MREGGREGGSEGERECVSVILVQLVSRETPTQCFAATFVKGQTRSIDYFTCRDCAFNCEYFLKLLIEMKGFCVHI